VGRQALAIEFRKLVFQGVFSAVISPPVSLLYRD
jgi:hypothetical protein